MGRGHRAGINASFLLLWETSREEKARKGLKREETLCPLDTIFWGAGEGCASITFWEGHKLCFLTRFPFNPTVLFCFPVERNLNHFFFSSPTCYESAISWCLVSQLQIWWPYIPEIAPFYPWELGFIIKITSFHSPKQALFCQFGDLSYS